MIEAFRIMAIAAVLAPGVAAGGGPPAAAGLWRLAPPGPGEAGAACELELLPAIAYEFEGVWHVARPLHYEDNRAACRALGVDDAVAWSGPDPGGAFWLLAEGEAGLIEFATGSGEWRVVRSGHAAPPRLVLTRMAGPGRQE